MRTVLSVSLSSIPMAFENDGEVRFPEMGKLKKITAALSVSLGMLFSLSWVPFSA